MTREGAPDLGDGREQVAAGGLVARLRRRFDEPTRRRMDIHRRELRRELSRLRDRRRLLAMGLLILTFGFLAAGIVGRGEPAGADARAYWAGVRIWLNGGDPYHPTGPFLPYVYAPWMLPLFAPWALLPWDVAWFVWRGGTILMLLWTIHWAYRQRPLETAILVALLAFPFGANLDTGNINLPLTLLLWGAQFTGPVVAGLLWSVATWMKWAPVLLLPILAPRARLWGLVFLAASGAAQPGDAAADDPPAPGAVRLWCAAAPARLPRLPVGGRAGPLAAARSVLLASTVLVGECARPPARPARRWIRAPPPRVPRARRLRRHGRPRRAGPRRFGSTTGRSNSAPSAK